ncbi:MAG: class I SAM-dependent methyltransferase [Acetobacteraceae bacterium]|nr:class I SAM-dependent methyltransferase [Acetobacteraceae bacterium]
MHFVEDYERRVANLLATHPLDEAMSLAVGGSYERIGAIERDLLRYAGLADGMALVDLGCGSGRLAHALGTSMRLGSYLGIDVVQALLDYARTKAPPDYRFVRSVSFELPAPDASADMVCAFSVFTHLLHEETYLYLEDIRRVLKPGGRCVFSFLEFAEPNHWRIFEATVEGRRVGAVPHLNTFIERSTIEAWARQLGFRETIFIGGCEAPWCGEPLGQSVALLRKAD